MDNSFETGHVHCGSNAQSLRGFSVVESIVMLVVLAVFTLIVIALLIRESGMVKDELQGDAFNSSVENAL